MAKVIGKHLTVDMYGCSFEQSRTTWNSSEHQCMTAVKDANMTLLDFCYYQFEPQGLDRSGAAGGKPYEHPHLSGARAMRHVDVFTCGDHSRPDKAVAISQEPCSNRKRPRVTNIRRGDFGSENDMKPKVKDHHDPDAPGPQYRRQSTPASSPEAK